ncbi:hypothetical protein ABID56_001453 [Alkalibacillus flavidus]|uniref:Uncharacterized protein n=1 Tax=Alkalibacillus flavidus TaxID=546021 RepID=A0ABV2KUV8_9BACI
MLISALVMGWVGVLIHLIIMSTFKKMIKHNEFAFLHLLMVFMYAMWLPLPITLYQLLDSHLLQVGIIFGFTYLFMIVVTMALQVGHITFVTKSNEEENISNEIASYVMGTLSNPFETIANVFKSIWALFLGLAFWNAGEYLMSILMLVFSLLFVYYLFIVLDTSVLRRIKLFSKVKANTLFINLETLLFFSVIMFYVTFHI